MADENMKKYFSPMPKMSMADTKRKTINYLQACKDKGQKIVQHCPSLLGSMFTMAAGMAGVDIARLSPCNMQIADDDETMRLAKYTIGEHRAMSPTIHLNYYPATFTFAGKETALGWFSRQARIPSCLWVSTTTS